MKVYNVTELDNRAMGASRASAMQEKLHGNFHLRVSNRIPEKKRI